MGKKLTAPMWFKESIASYRAMRAKGDLSVSEMYELLADDIQTHHDSGEPFGRAIWIDYVTAHDARTTKAHADEAAEQAAFAAASGFLQSELFSKDVLDSLGLPAELDLGGFGKTIATPDARHADVRRYKDELERKKKSWDDSLDGRIRAAEKALEILPEDNSRTLRQVVTDPEEYGFGAEAQ